MINIDRELKSSFLKVFSMVSPATLATISLGIFFSISLLTQVTVLPLTDGWYETLIYLKKNGFDPYADLDFKFPPGVIMFFELMDAVLGSSLLAHKVFGVFLTLITAILLFNVSSKFASRYSSFLGGLFFFLITVFSAAYISRDYHSFLDFALVFYVIHNKDNGGKPRDRRYRPGAAGTCRVSLLAYSPR